MKKMVLAVFIISGILLLWSSRPASSAVGNVSDSRNKHNLSASGSSAYRAQTETQICIFCHTPHTALGSGPLWNHTLSAAAYTVSKKGVDSPTQLSMPLNPPDGSSKLCLSCHDGTVPLGSVQNTIISMRTVGAGNLTGSSVIGTGTDLRLHHLVSIEYNGTLATAGTLVGDKQIQCGSGISMKLLAPPAAPYTQPTHNIYSPGCLTPLIGCSDPANWHTGVQCTSCHDAHYDNNLGSVPSSKFLRDTTANASWPYLVYDALCLRCHTPCP